MYTYLYLPVAADRLVDLVNSDVASAVVSNGSHCVLIGSVVVC